MYDADAKVTNLFLSSIVCQLTCLQAQPRLCQPHICFHPVWLYGPLFISTAFVDCHHFVLLHLNTCLKVLITACGLWSQTHPMALHMLSAIPSDRNDSFVFFHIFLATLAVLVGSLSTSHLLLVFSIEIHVSSRLFPILQFYPKWHDSSANFRFQSKRHCRHVPPCFCTSLSTLRLCFCKCSHLSTRPCLHFASFLPSNLVFSPDGSS